MPYIMYLFLYTKFAYHQGRFPVVISATAEHRYSLFFLRFNAAHTLIYGLVSSDKNNRPLEKTVEPAWALHLIIVAIYRGGVFTAGPTPSPS